MYSKLLTRLGSALVCPLLLLAAASRAQTTLQVGSGQPYSTIQSAIDAASPGDTVLVAPGTYTENIDFKGKAITVTSSGGPAVTTIDGGSKGGVATVVFKTGETNASILSNFTIRGGGNSIFVNTSDGGIFVSNASATIQNNIVTANYCHNIDVEFGTATILNNEISGVLQDTNGTQGESYCTFSSAIHLQGTPNSVIPYGPSVLGSVVIGNTIENNLTGSAINIWAAQNVLISNNIIRNNQSSDPGSAFISANSGGTILFQNLIYKNTSTCGGAIGFMNSGYSAYSLVAANNTIVDNVTPQPSGGSECTAISQIYPGPYAYGESNPNAEFINNILSGSTSYPAVNCAWLDSPSESIQPTFQNNILYNAGGPFFGSRCVDVSGKYNNIAADPQFVSPSTGDYHLKPTSPAIDAGQNSILQTLLAMTGRSLSADLDNKPRIQNATGKGCIVDIGAYESPGSQDVCSTTETLTASPNPSFFGQTVTFTAQLSSPSGTPTGDVQFSDGATVLATQPISSTGVSTFSTSALSVGTHPITATFQPTGSFPAATATVSQVVNGYPTLTALSCSATPLSVFQTAQLDAVVTSANGVPTGSLTFTDNGATLSTLPLAAGAATLAYTPLTAGTHTLTATFTPTGGFGVSTGSCSQTVNKLPSTSVLSVSPTSSTFGAPVTLTATVSSASPLGTSTPTGTVTFLNAGSPLGTSTLANGAASLTLTTLPGGADNLTCTYSGSTVYAASSCNLVPVAITAAPSALTLTSSSNPAIALSPITFTAALSVNGKPAPAGNTITLALDGETFVLSTDAAGLAVYTTTVLRPATYPVTANFAATSSLLASTASLTEIVTPSPTSTTLTAAPNPAFVGQAVTLTATIAAQGTSAQPSGSVSFYDGPTLLDTQQLNTSSTGVITISNGFVPSHPASPHATQTLSSSISATFTTSTLAVGTHPLTAVYSPDNPFLPSTSPVVNEQVLASGFTISLAPAAITLPAGTASTVAIHLASVGNFAGPLSLSYGPLPPDATASIAPSTVTLTAGGAASSTLTLNTLLRTASRAPSRPSSRELPVALAAFALLLIPSRRRILPRLLSVALLAVALHTVTGCTNTWYTAASVAPGTYQVPVIATDVNHNSQTATLTVTVTPNP